MRNDMAKLEECGFHQVQKIRGAPLVHCGHPDGPSPSGESLYFIFYS